MVKEQPGPSQSPQGKTLWPSPDLAVQQGKGVWPKPNLLLWGLGLLH